MNANHEEAYQLACYKREASNLARAYIELKALAQELHALLVECGEALDTCSHQGDDDFETYYFDRKRVYPTLDKLKQAGIV